MKIASAFLNTVLCIILFIVILLTQFTIFTIISKEAHTDTIKVISAKEEEVSYVDGITFMITDIGANLEAAPKYRVRSWFANETWEKCTLWADFAIDKVWGVFRPIFLPTYDVYLMQVTHMEDYESFRIKDDKNLLDEYESAAWIYIIDSEQFQKYFANKLEQRNFLNTVKASKLSLPYYYYEETIANVKVERILTVEQFKELSSGKLPEELKDKDIKKYQPEMTKSQWIKEYKEIYNFIEKFVKYNNKPYSLYHSKFIDARGEIKTATISVYCQLIVSLVLAIYFTCQNKITLKENDYKESEIRGGIRLPGFGPKKNSRRKRR